MLVFICQKKIKVQAVIGRIVVLAVEVYQAEVKDTCSSNPHVVKCCSDVDVLHFMLEIMEPRRKWTPIAEEMYNTTFACAKY